GGFSATAPSPTSPCNRNSGRRASTVRSLVLPGLGGAAAWPSAGSDRCSGPTLITTCSNTSTGPMPMTTFGPMPTMTSTTASTVLTPTVTACAFKLVRKGKLHQFHALYSAFPFESNGGSIQYIYL